MTDSGSMTNPSEAIQPCPFCGSTEAALSDPPVPWLVICAECGAEGPYADKRKDAIVAWNSRAQQAATPAAPVQDERPYLVEELRNEAQGIRDGQPCADASLLEAAADRLTPDRERPAQICRFLSNPQRLFAKRPLCGQVAGGSTRTARTSRRQHDEPK